MMQPTNHHEIGAGYTQIEASSDRSFGLVFAAAFALLTAYFGWHGSGWWPALLIVAAAFLILALIRPVLLAWPNWLWMKLGFMLGAIIAPIVMGLIYFTVFTPMGLIARLFGKDFLRLRRAPTASTYWVPRQDQQPTPESLRDQF
jgi:Saxitoxin biosynthesis operon protein SxtJ